MKKDPVIAEIRSIRQQIERECGNSAKKYYSFLLGIQQQVADRVVCRPPKRTVRGAKIRKAG